MRLVYVIIIVTFGLYACTPSKQATKQYQGTYTERIDSLVLFFKASNHRLYKIETQHCDLGKYDSMSEIDLMRKNVPFKKDEQSKYVVIQYLNRLTKELRSKQSVFTISHIKKLLGEPTNRYQASYEENTRIYEYKLDSGFECPNCNVAVHRIFESCDYLKFKENTDKRIIDLSFEIYYSGLK